MSQKTYKVLKDAKARALIDDETYQKWYKQSIKDPEKFWGKHGKRIDWFKPYTKVKNTNFNGKVSIKWFEDGTDQRLLQLHRPAPGEARRSGPRSSGKATTL
jgi:acetyl-CoA synthetase